MKSNSGNQDINFTERQVSYQDPDATEWRKALVNSWAGKVTGENNHCVNIKHLLDDAMKVLLWKVFQVGKKSVKNFYYAKMNCLR